MLKKISYSFLLLYLFFIPIGPLPIQTPLGVKVDVLIGILLLLLAIGFFKNFTQYSVTMFFLVGFLLISTLTSTLLSQDINFSLKSWLIMIGYMYLTLIIPTIYFPKFDSLSSFIILIATIVGLFIIISYSTLDIVGRYNISQVISFVDDKNMRLDPNTTAIGLCFSMLFLGKIKDRYSSFIIIIIVVSAVLILQSRTAIIAFILAIIFSRFYLFFEKNDTLKFLPLKSLSTFFIIIFLASFFYLLFPDVVDIYISRLLSGSNNEHRFDMITTSYNLFSEDTKTIFFGVGYMLLNPHNEFLRILFCSGIFGLISSVIWMIYIFYLISKIIDIETKFKALSIYMFLIFASMPYGHTKFIYVSLMFILMLYLKDRSSRRLAMK
jgi:hypothetical protein